MAERVAPASATARALTKPSSFRRAARPRQQLPVLAMRASALASRARSEVPIFFVIRTDQRLLMRRVPLGIAA
jgi:hypothetical protein